MFRRISFAVVCGMFLLCSANCGAEVILTEDFNYPDGPLAVANPAWVFHSGTADTLFVSGGAAAVTQDSGSEDLHRLFDGAAAYSSGVVSASFDITVTVPDDPTTGAPGVMVPDDYEFFVHFWQSTAPTNFRARTDIQVPNVPGPGNDYTIGISTLASASEVTLPVDFTFGTVVPVSIAFDIDMGTASLTAGGETVNTAVVSLGTLIDGFALRQSSSSSDETIRVDNLVVTHIPVPEPTSWMLMLSSLLGLAACRRK